MTESLSPTCRASAPDLSPNCPPSVPERSTGPVSVYGMLFSERKSDLNLTSQWAMRYRQLFDRLVSDACGGVEFASEAKQSLIRRICVLSIELERCELRLAKMETPSDTALDLYGRLSGHLRRSLEVLGLERVARDITRDYLSDAIAAMPAPTGRASESK